MWRVTKLTENRWLKAVAVPVSRLLKQRVKLQLLLIRHLLSAQRIEGCVCAPGMLSAPTRGRTCLHCSTYMCTRCGKQWLSATK